MAKGKICRIDGCKSILKIQDGQVCGAHRLRFMRHGNYEISPNWQNLKKGQALLTPLGYLRINVGGKRILHHRYIMEQHIGRPLKPTERVHHKNHIRDDNRIENLELMKDNSEHMKTHHQYMWKNRSVSPPYSPKEVSNVLKRVNKPFGSHKKCFCKQEITSRNLCVKHYQWAYAHKFCQ